MATERDADQRFQDFLEGTSDPSSPGFTRLAALTAAIQPRSLPAPSAAFRLRLRNELLASASVTEEDVFAALLDGSPVEAPEEMRPLVAVATAIGGGTLAAPTPAFRFQLRNRLLTEAQGRPAPLAAAKEAVTRLRLRRRTRLVAALGMAAIAMFSTGVVFAAANGSARGDLLYPVKQLHEGARLAALSGGPEGRARLTFARERLSEVATLKNRGTVGDGLFIQTLDDMDGLTVTGTRLLIDAFDRTGDRRLVEFVESFAGEQIRDLTTLVNELPPGVRPAARDSLTLAHRTADQAERTLIGCGVCPNDPLLTTPTAHLRPSDGSATPACDCPPDGTTRGNGSDDGRDPSEREEPTGGGDDPDPGPEPEEPQVDLPDGLPDEFEQPTEDLLDGVLDSVKEELEETLPPLPVQPSIPPVPGL